MDKSNEILSAIFGASAPFYIDVFDEIRPILASHEYHFIRDEVWNELLNSGKLAVSAINQVLALELIDKAHLAAATALFRTTRWLSAISINYEGQNFLGWASSVRGLLESSGDILDGLLNVAGSLAARGPQIAKVLAGKANEAIYGFSELEHVLDHFVLAKWMRAPKGDVRKAKENAEYVQAIPLPGIMDLYRRLCGITHPSSASIDYLYDASVEGFKLNFKNDGEAIDRLINEFQKVFQEILSYGCNPPFLILRVLHRFDHHPKLGALRKIDFSPIPAWSRIERDLKRR
jgi:hypothetical protein